MRCTGPLGALPKAALLLYFFNVLLDFLCKMWPKCRARPHFIAPHVGHTSKSYDFLLKVITFQLRLYSACRFPSVVFVSLWRPPCPRRSWGLLGGWRMRFRHFLCVSICDCKPEPFRSHFTSVQDGSWSQLVRFRTSTPPPKWAHTWGSQGSKRYLKITEKVKIRFSPS